MELDSSGLNPVPGFPKVVKVSKPGQKLKGLGGKRRTGNPGSIRATKIVLSPEPKGKADTRRFRTKVIGKGCMVKGKNSDVEYVKNPRQMLKALLHGETTVQAVELMRAYINDEAVPKSDRLKAADLVLKYGYGESGPLLFTATKQAWIESTLELFAEYVYSPNLANLEPDQAVAEFAIRLQERIRDMA